MSLNWLRFFRSARARQRAIVAAMETVQYDPVQAAFERECG